MSEVTVKVVAGQKREEVGRVKLEPEMVTSVGEVLRVTPAGTVFYKDKNTGEERRLKSLDGVTVTLSEARRFGYDGGPARRPRKKAAAAPATV